MSPHHTFARFTRAIVRPPAHTFAQGLTTASLGAPDHARTLEQHAAYCRALVRSGCGVVELPADDRYPDSTFVEDIAFVLPGQGAILTRPGASSRQGEVEMMRDAIHAFFPEAAQMVAPGTLDAGDVCEVGTHVFIGISQRTNEHGAQQLVDWLAGHRCTASTVDIRDTPGILHLKSGVCALDTRRLVAIDALAEHDAFLEYDVVRVPEHEAYAANCVRVNDVVFVAAGFPITHARLRELGYSLEVLDMSEFERMDGGLSCLSVRC